MALAPFSVRTEAWRPLVSRLAGDLPTDVLMAWIQRESRGNPCSYTSMGEAGIWQLMPPDNIAQAGTTVAQLRAACSGNTQNLTRDLTDEENIEQVRSGVKYINLMRKRAHEKLDAAGVPWSENTPMFWQFVKLQHAYPAPSQGWLSAATALLGRPPESWAEYRSAIPSGYETVLNNAEWVGGYYSKTVLSPVILIVSAAAIGLAALVYSRR